MAASIKCDERPFKGGSGGALPPQPKTGGSGGQRPPAKIEKKKLFFIFRKVSLEKSVLGDGEDGNDDNDGSKRG